MIKRRLFYSFPIIFLLITAAAGWFATDYLGNKAWQEIIRESQADALNLSTYVTSIFTITEGLVKSPEWISFDSSRTDGPKVIWISNTPIAR